MRNSFKTMLILALGAGMASLSSCSEDEGNDTDPMVPEAIVCYPTTVTETSDGETITTTYEYNAENQLTTSSYVDGSFTSTTTYAYTAGNLTTATTGTEISTFVYADGGTYPTRINTSEDGEPSYFSVITTTDGNVTKIENSYYDENDNAILEDVTTLTYENGMLTGAKTEAYDPDTETFETELELRDIVLDGKKAPFNQNFAFAFEQEFNPVILVAQNVLSANLIGELEGEEIKLPYTGTYTYNDNNYPVTSTQSISGFFNTDFTYEYNCK